MTDRQRDQIDAETKQLLRELNARIRMLADAEQVRQNTEETVRRSKYARMGLGALGKWAAGGVGQSKSLEEQLDEAKSNQVKMHRESVLWYLREKLQECGQFQAEMMEKRIMRQLEKNKNMISMSRVGPELGGFENAPIPPSKTQGSSAAHMESIKLYPEQDLTPEQIQMFEQENQDMLKHYESTLDQVRLVGRVSWRCLEMLTVAQDGRKISHRNIRVANTAGEQFGDAISTHRPTSDRFLLHSGECRRWKQAIEEGSRTEEHSEIRVLRLVWTEFLLGRVGFSHLRSEVPIIASQLREVSSAVLRMFETSCF